MARFQLKDKHYLNVPGTVWEQKETDQVTGKQGRKEYQVGLYLNPDDPADCNYSNPWRIIVATKRDPNWPADIIFAGPPTHDMEPLDDEARELQSQLKGKADPFADLPNTIDMTLSDKLVAMLEKKMKSGEPAPQDDRIAALELQIAELKSLLTQGAKSNAPANGLSLRRS